MKKLAAFIALVSLIGCATMESGKPLDAMVASSFKEGVTTRTEIEAKLGQPQSVTRNANGSSVLVYVHMITKANGLTGKSGGTGHTAAYRFDPAGVLQSSSVQEVGTRIR